MTFKTEVIFCGGAKTVAFCAGDGAWRCGRCGRPIKVVTTDVLTPDERR